MTGRPEDHSSRLLRGELGESSRDEWAEAERPEASMRRREFLERTGVTAGAISLASMLPADELLAQASRRVARRRPLPKPRDLPIDTFVVLMMENRSFDHYFGWHPKADGRNEGLRFPDANGRKIETQHLTPDFQGCEFRDPDHGWDGGRWQYNGGRNDRFVTGNADGDGSDEFAIGYYLKQDLGFIPHVAQKYTLYDRWFCSLMASTYPNRHYQWGAQNGGQKSNKFPFEVPGQETGFTWETIFDRAQKRGLSVGYFASDLPFAALYGQRGIRWTKKIEEFYARAATGTLPNICFVDPPFANGGGGDGLSADEHPHGDIRLGQAFMADITQTFVESPQYKRGAMFINYDEWGGFFDHVKPPFVPDDRQSSDLYENWGFTGFRVPGVAVSPYSRRGGVSHMTVTHESILKLISYRFGLGHLTRRHRFASNIGRSFNFKRPRFDPPELPTPEQITAVPCSVQGNGAGRSARPSPHDMVELETSGWLDRLGYEVPDANLDQILRYPDKVRRALQESARR